MGEGAAEEVFLRWLQGHGGKVHPNVRVGLVPTCADRAAQVRGVLAVGPIKKEEEVVSVPEELALLSNNSSIAEQLKSFGIPDPMGSGNEHYRTVYASTVSSSPGLSLLGLDFLETLV